jgi:hypothetical protein
LVATVQKIGFEPIEPELFPLAALPVDRSNPTVPVSLDALPLNL